jgi:hypothetical protein
MPVGTVIFLSPTGEMSCVSIASYHALTTLSNDWSIKLFSAILYLQRSQPLPERPSERKIFQDWNFGQITGTFCRELNPVLIQCQTIESYPPMQVSAVQLMEYPI